mmetsp:Transcript_7533/g.13585  ORF Transcript_7533/g.13585 Transcript_7533/m.13585 type:complete len:490 (+) Transcript_7533:55-1524(+)
MAAASDGSASDDEVAAAPAAVVLPKPPAPLTTPDSIQRNKEEQARVLEQRLMQGMEALQLDHKRKTDMLHTTLNQQKNHVNQLLAQQVRSIEKTLDRRLEEQINLIKMARKDGLEAAKAAAAAQRHVLQQRPSFDVSQQVQLPMLPALATYSLAPVPTMATCPAVPGPVLPYVPPPVPLTPAGSFAPPATTRMVSGVLATPASFARTVGAATPVGSYVAPPGSYPPTPIGSHVPVPVAPLMLPPPPTIAMPTSSYVPLPGPTLSRAPSHCSVTTTSQVVPPVILPAPVPAGQPLVMPSAPVQVSPPIITAGPLPAAPPRVQMSTCLPPELPAWSRPLSGLPTAPAIRMLPAAPVAQPPAQAPPALSCQSLQAPPAQRSVSASRSSVIAAPASMVAMPPMPVVARSESRSRAPPSVSLAASMSAAPCGIARTSLGPALGYGVPCTTVPSMRPAVPAAPLASSYSGPCRPGPVVPSIEIVAPPAPNAFRWS